MADNESKIIKFTITILFTEREHSQYELIKKPLLHGLERHLCFEWIKKINQHNLQSNERQACSRL